MEKITIRLDEKQYAHIEKLADGAGCSEADIVAGLVELDRLGRLRNNSPEIEELVKKLYAAVCDKPQPTAGRSKTFSPELENRILEMKAGGMIEAEIVRAMRADCGDVKISRGSVRRVLLRATS